MTLNALKSFFVPGARLVVAAAVGALLFVYLDGVVLPRMKDATSIPFQMVGFFLACYTLFFLAALVGTAGSLFMGRWIPALYCFAASCIGIISIYASLMLRGDRFTFVAAAHSEIAEIYRQRRSEFVSRDLTSRLIGLDDQCGPPNGCECWLLLDPASSSGAERDIDGWHRPIASVFPTNNTPEHFAVVNVKRLDSDAYSVLGCEWDPTAWWLR
jgi:hypothetical protein